MGDRFGEIGIPNRNGSEFMMGDQYNHWGMYLLYAKLFPNDVDYTIGKSNYRKDWFFEQVPSAAHGQPGGGFNGSDTTWTIHFNVDGAQKGCCDPAYGHRGRCSKACLRGGERA